jgi:hypothetical protein
MQAIDFNCLPQLAAMRGNLPQLAARFPLHFVGLCDILSMVLMHRERCTTAGG